MRILISNDDGYRAGGIHVLARIMASFGDVTVVAPKYHQSAMSMAVSLGMKKLAYKKLPDEGPGKWAYLDATPASCVKFGLEYGYENRDPDLVICGVRGLSNIKYAFVGSVSTHLIRNVKCDVLVVRPETLDEHPQDEWIDL